MQSHLGSSDPKIRSLGMVVAESLTKTLQPHGPQLTFEVTIGSLLPSSWSVICMCVNHTTSVYVCIYSVVSRVFGTLTAIKAAFE